MVPSALDGTRYCCRSAVPCSGSTVTTACKTCAGTGACVSACNHASGCFGDAVSVLCAATIPCNRFVAGWSGIACERWASVGGARCTIVGICATASDTALCDMVSSDVPNTRATISSCPSLACRNASACQSNALVSSSDSRAKVCLLNTDVVGCNPPTAEACSNVLAGWNGRVCERYSRSSFGRCDETGACITSCSQVPLQTTVVHLACDHIGCVKPGACVNGTNANSSPLLSSVCFTDNTRHNCPAGATCDATGACSVPSSAPLSTLSPSVTTPLPTTLPATLPAPVHTTLPMSVLSPIPAPPTTALSSATATTREPGNDDALIAGIVGGSIALLLVCGCVALVLARSRRQREKEAENSDGGALRNSNDDPPSKYSERIVIPASTSRNHYDALMASEIPS
jgi:hypothetical protein